MLWTQLKKENRLNLILFGLIFLFGCIIFSVMMALFIE